MRSFQEANNLSSQIILIYEPRERQIPTIHASFSYFLMNKVYETTGERIK